MSLAGPARQRCAQIRSIEIFIYSAQKLPDHEDNGLQTRHNGDEGIAVFICEVTALASEESV